MATTEAKEEINQEEVLDSAHKMSKEKVEAKQTEPAKSDLGEDKTDAIDKFLNEDSSKLVDKITSKLSQTFDEKLQEIQDKIDSLTSSQTSDNTEAETKDEEELLENLLTPEEQISKFKDEVSQKMSDLNFKLDLEKVKSKLPWVTELEPDIEKYRKDGYDDETSFQKAVYPMLIRAVENQNRKASEEAGKIPFVGEGIQNVSTNDSKDKSMTKELVNMIDSFYNTNGALKL